MRHIFLSPHLDDAILSAGNYICTLCAQKKHILIVTIFSSFRSRFPSFDAWKNIVHAGCMTPTQFEKKRKKEDSQAMDLLGVPFHHMDYIDGGFRKNEKGKHLYPSFADVFRGDISPEDKALIPKIQASLSSIIRPSDTLYAPLAFGNHIDHIITRQIVSTFPNTTYFWLDQPYAWNNDNDSRNWDFFNSGNREKRYQKSFRISHDKKKEEALSCYRSQIPILFPQGIPPMDDVFFEKIPTRKR